MSNGTSRYTISQCHSLATAVINASFTMFAVYSSDKDLEYMSRVVQVKFAPPSVLRMDDKSSTDAIPVPTVVTLCL